MSIGLLGCRNLQRTAEEMFSASNYFRMVASMREKNQIKKVGDLPLPPTEIGGTIQGILRMSVKQLRQRAEFFASEAREYYDRAAECGATNVF